MVFESIVADLLNRYLGENVVNLDASQLNIGIWAGDVKLENLEVKETALDDFDLPIKLKYGFLSSLVLKIPWNNLYNEPVIAKIDGLNLIVVPNKGVVYNDEEARKYAMDIKQKTLARLEDARRLKRKPPDPSTESFYKNLLTQVINNLQVTISNIHVRFEDKYTNRLRPFCMGVTMEKLDFQTTDADYKPAIHLETDKLIYKLVSLQNLDVYWNSDSNLISDLEDKNEIRKQLHDTIHRGKNSPQGFKYILQLIQMQAQMKLNQQPENDQNEWNTPRMDLAFDMKSLSLTIDKLQYQDILLYLDGQERNRLAGPYLKYRPNLNEYKGHYKTWWRFAYTAILETRVRRRRQDWNWGRMKKHRELAREYRTAWLRRLTENSLGPHTLNIVDLAEMDLDVFNLNMARHQAEMEIDRKGLTRLEDLPQGWVAWGYSWFGEDGSANSPKKELPDKDSHALDDSWDYTDLLNKKSVLAEVACKMDSLTMRFLDTIEIGGEEKGRVMAMQLEGVYSVIDMSPSRHDIKVKLDVRDANIQRLLALQNENSSAVPDAADDSLLYSTSDLTRILLTVGRQENENLSSKDEKNPPLISLSFNRHSTAQLISNKIDCSVRPLSLMYDEGAFEGFVDFFAKNIPEDADDSETEPIETHTFGNCSIADVVVEMRGFPKGLFLAEIGQPIACLHMQELQLNTENKEPHMTTVRFFLIPFQNLIPYMPLPGLLMKVAS
ncbi:hypothetical protein WR25_01297 [Diploscapter pachys]|uniref:Chorein N-terminal domain-containing protein n=1 Tax=Diploscapter pachys TaxID=2018661 RepID=A0A2A2J3H5_9BILA|nr:hypothetical protein WR25_01297 [Diploscapter pachys]